MRWSPSDPDEYVSRGVLLAVGENALGFNARGRVGDRPLELEVSVLESISNCGLKHCCDSVAFTGGKRTALRSWSAPGGGFELDTDQ
jgi:hypothetical protein